MKQFIFDRLIDRENICGLKKETGDLKKLIDDKQNILLYAPRNFGKTSLIKNVIIPDFKKTHKDNFVLFADLMGVKDLNSINLRLNHALATSLKESFPIKNAISSVTKYLTNIKPTVSVDATSGEITVSISSSKGNDSIANIEDIFQTINKINKDIPSLIVIDEFQDIFLIDESEALFRNAFQQITELPIVVLGSKRHLLKNIFGLPASPLAGWGKDVNIEPIKYEEYHEYIEERFKQKGLEISLEVSTHIQNEMQRVPESINMLCYEIYQNYEKQKITLKIVHEMMLHLLEAKTKRFETILTGLSVAEEKVIIQIAEADKGFKPQSKEFSQKVDLTPKSVKVNIDKLMNQGIIDFDENYYICDPLFRYYLREYRK